MPGPVIEQASEMALPITNGTQHSLPNGIPAKPAVEQNGGHIGEEQNGAKREGKDEERARRQGAINGLTQDEKENGASDLLMHRPDGLPIEIRHLTQHFRPFHVLVHRSVQQTWNSFSDLIDQLAEITVVPGVTAPNASYAKPLLNGATSGNQSRENLEKKDRLLNFQQDQRALFIKFLVLHDWYKKSRGIDQVIEISMWINEQRLQFAQAADFVGNMKRELALWQIPNPDLKTAIEVLSNGRVSTLSDLGYVPAKPLSSRAMLRTLQDINILICTRLSVHDEVPPPMSKYLVHDGRVTFTVRHEFELDLSVADEDPSSQFYFIDFRFLFSQQPSLLTGRLHDNFTNTINDMLREGGLLGCYNFLHDLTLSHKLNSLRRQALDMARKQWSENVRVDLINRTLVVQYWVHRPGPKSWIEIGVKSGRRRTRRDRTRSTEPFLDLRWMPGKAENEDIHVDLNLSPLSLEDILHGVISRHSSIILDRLYEKLLEFKLYADGKYLLELSSSDTEPSDCSLKIQLTSKKHITLSLEPIAGSLILQPASPLSGRTEFELNRLQNPVEDGVQRIGMLHCLAAEQEMIQQAGLAGWEVLQTLQLSQQELRALFPQNVLRYVLIRQASWQRNAMVAATFSMEGDSWWLLYPGRAGSMIASLGLLSQPIDCSKMHDDGKINSLAFFSQLNDYASGEIVFRVAEQELRQQGLSCQLPALFQPQRGLQTPLMKVQYVLGDANRALRPSATHLPPKEAQIRDNATSDDHKAHPSWIQPTVCLKFCGLNKETRDALILAKGRTTVSAKVFESLNCLTGSGFKVNEKAGEFLMSFQVSVGNSIVSDLFTGLQNLDSLLSCLTIVKSFDSMRIQSLSLSQIAIEYNREAELSASISFPSSTSSVAIQLLPEGSNPQARLTHFVENLLADIKRPFTANLGGVLTMLTTTHPLLTLFDELEKLQIPSATTAETTTLSSSSTIRLHVIARSPTHYALQYFDSDTKPRTMIARFEIFRHLRRDTPVWILRPALEETVSYDRSSFINKALKQKLTNDVFDVRGAQGWLGLDTAASCPIHSPGPLVKKVDDAVRTWAKESLKDVAGDGHKEDESIKVEIKEQTAESNGVLKPPQISTTQPQQQHKPTQQHPQQQRAGNTTPRTPVNGTHQNRPATSTTRPPPQGHQKPKDVITLD